MYDQKREFVETHAPEWDVSHTGTLICPCGVQVEDDGKCPDGHVSPMREMCII